MSRLCSFYLHFCPFIQSINQFFCQCLACVPFSIFVRSFSPVQLLRSTPSSRPSRPCGPTPWAGPGRGPPGQPRLERSRSSPVEASMLLSFLLSESGLHLHVDQRRRPDATELAVGPLGRPWPGQGPGRKGGSTPDGGGAGS